MKYVLNTGCGHPDAEDAKVTQRTQKGRKGIQSYFLIAFNFSENLVFIFVSIFGFLLRPLRNFCVLCVQKFSPSPLRAASMI
jgi:hypothetical protein